jgi:hypothetical protein
MKKIILTSLTNPDVNIIVSENLNFNLMHITFMIKGHYLKSYGLYTIAILRYKIVRLHDFYLVVISDAFNGRRKHGERI